jgi:DNA-binding transcriptional LysR family regulator
VQIDNELPASHKPQMFLATSCVCFNAPIMVLSSRMPDLDSLEVFAAIAQTGSLGGAARELGLTQQAVSRRLASLESRTAVALVIRSKRGSRLTPAGTFLAEWASHILDVAHDIDTALGSLRNDGAERLTVAASPTIAEYLMPHWLLSLRSAASRRDQTVPRISLAAANSALATALVRDGTVDLGFIESPNPPEGLRHCVVGTDELVVVVPPSHAWARRSRAVSALELAQTSLVCREPRAGIRDSLTVALRRVLGIDMEQATPVLELPSTGAVRAAVIAGAGPAVMSSLAVADDLVAGRLREIAVPDLDLRRDLRAIWLGGSSRPASAITSLLAHIGCCTDGLNREGGRMRSSAGQQKGA